MTDPIDQQLLVEVERDEGLVLKAYPDPLSPLAKWLAAGIGKRTLGTPGRPAGLSGAPWTIGYGHTGPEVHEGLEWTPAQAYAALLTDLALHNALLARVAPWTAALDPVRRRVFQNLIFNMGWDNPKTPAHEGLSGFVHTLAAAGAGDWPRVAEGLKASLWYRQTGDRAKRLVAQVLTGVEAV